mmetsp:Transcript_29227/g.71138  ORF Transcript_29227/g.71138 Transcript_29227/m.71138 type:complete len:200 (+) Transcript_29227:750-1349(+)
MAGAADGASSRAQCAGLGSIWHPAAFTSTLRSCRCSGSDCSRELPLTSSRFSRVHCAKLAGSSGNSRYLSHNCCTCFSRPIPSSAPPTTWAPPQNCNDTNCRPQQAHSRFKTSSSSSRITGWCDSTIQSTLITDMGSCSHNLLYNSDQLPRDDTSTTAMLTSKLLELVFRLSFLFGEARISAARSIPPAHRSCIARCTE